MKVEKTSGKLLSKFRDAGRKVDMLNAMKSDNMKQEDKNKQPQWLEKNNASSTIRMTMASSAELAKALYHICLPSSLSLKSSMKNKIDVNHDKLNEMKCQISESDKESDEFEVVSSSSQEMQSSEEEMPLITVKSILYARSIMKVSEGDRLNSAKQKLEESRNNVSKNK